MRSLRVVVAVLATAGFASTALSAARGDLDPTFGSGGKVTTDFGGSEIGWAVAVQPDGRIVVAGERLDPGPHDFVLVRYTANGRPDPSFDGDGKVATDFGGTSDGALDVEVQSDGKIMAVGRGAQDFALARYRTDGTLDPSFGEGGKVLTAFEPGSIDTASAVRVLGNRKLVAGGGTRSGTASDFALARYLPNGSLDPSFGSGGLVITPISGAADHLFDLAVLPGGKLVAAGWSFEGGGPHIALARYNPDGSLDPSFDGDGIVLASFRSAGTHLLVQRDGKLVVSGVGTVSRFTADGSLDRSFGEGGTARSGTVEAFGATIQPDGKVLVIGSAITGRAATGDFGIARLTADGRLDPTYGRGGSVLTGFASGSDDQALDGVLLRDGKLVVSGMSNATPALGAWGPWDIAVARYVAIRFCLVPNIRRQVLAAARAGLLRAGCRLGTVAATYSRTVGKGRVISQRPRPGSLLAEQAKVSLVVSRGWRR